MNMLKRYYEVKQELDKLEIRMKTRHTLREYQRTQKLRRELYKLRYELIIG